MVYIQRVVILAFIIEMINYILIKRYHVFSRRFIQNI